jgi:hypothetical protein
MHQCVSSGYVHAQRAVSYAKNIYTEDYPNGGQHATPIANLRPLKEINHRTGLPSPASPCSELVNGPVEMASELVRSGKAHICYGKYSHRQANNKQRTNSDAPIMSTSTRANAWEISKGRQRAAAYQNQHVEASGRLPDYLWARRRGRGGTRGRFGRRPWPSGPASARAQPRAAQQRGGPATQEADRFVRRSGRERQLAAPHAPSTRVRKTARAAKRS